MYLSVGKERLPLLKSGVGEAVPERIGNGRCPFLQEIPVSNVCSFSIFRITDIPYAGILLLPGQEGLLPMVVIGEMGRRRKIEVVRRESDRQASAGIDFPGEDARQGVPAFLSGLPCEDDGIRKTLPGGGLDDPADIEDDDHLLRLTVEDLHYVGKQLLFGRRQQEIPFQVTVPSFARLAGDGQYGHIG